MDDLHRLAERARRISDTTDPEQVLRSLLEAVRSMGFAAADLCQRREGHPWVMSHRVAREDVAVVPPEQLAAASVVSVGTVTVHERDPEDVQWLHEAGVRFGAATPLHVDVGHWVVVRVWAVDDPEQAAQAVELVELLVTQASAALRNAQMFTELADRSRRFQHEAHHDPLTGLPNRAAFLVALDGALAEPAPPGTTPARVLFLDLDGFKAVNDDLGHEAGDQVLCEVARRLRATVPDPHLVARLAGDEFVVLLRPGHDPELLAPLAARIVERVGQPIGTRGGPAVVGTSIGVAGAADGVTAAALLRRADEAMYLAKRDGGRVARHWTGHLDRTS